MSPRASTPRANLVVELDRLRLGLEGLDRTAGGAEHLAAVQERLTELVTDLLSEARAPEERVNIGLASSPWRPVA